MKTIARIVPAALLCATPALAAAGKGGEFSLLMTLFMGFVALVIAFQLVPALLLLFAMVKGIFSAVAQPQAHGEQP